VNSLDGLFSEALDRAAIPATQERRGAVAEVTVQGARRKRRARAVGQAVGTLAVAGIAITAAALLLGGNDASPANPALSPSTAPNVQAALDSRFPKAPTMDSDAWTGVRGDWDAELASFANQSSTGGGISYAIYLTPPEGSRLQVFAASGLPPLESPILLGLDFPTRTAYVYDKATSTLGTLNLMNGDYSEASWQPDGTLTDAWPLGREPDGSSLFALRMADAAGGLTDHVFEVRSGVVTELLIPGTDPSPAWGFDVITSTDDGLAITNVVGVASTTIPDTQGCAFTNWNADGSISADCDATADSAEGMVAINVGTGERSPSKASPGTTVNAIYLFRTWTGEGTFGSQIRPPVVTDAEGNQTDLSQGFVGEPDTYTVIFGAFQ
jgi:hypothetical protein